jgi:hypothetical protein
MFASFRKQAKEQPKPLTIKALKMIGDLLNKPSRENLTDAKDGVVAILENMPVEEIFKLFVKIGALVKAQKDRLGDVDGPSYCVVHWSMHGRGGKTPFEFVVQLEDGSTSSLPVCYFHGIHAHLPGWKIMGCSGAVYGDGSPKYDCKPMPFWEAIGTAFTDICCHLAGNNKILLPSESFLFMVFAVLHHLGVPLSVQLEDILRISAGEIPVSVHGRMLLESHVVEFLLTPDNKIAMAANAHLFAFENDQLAEARARLRNALDGEAAAIARLHKQLEAAHAENNQLRSHIWAIEAQTEQLQCQLASVMQGYSVPFALPGDAYAWGQGDQLTWKCEGCGVHPTMCGPDRAACYCGGFALCQLSVDCEVVAGLDHDCISQKVLKTTWSCQRFGCIPQCVVDCGKRYCRCQDKSVELCPTHGCMLPATHPHNNCATLARAHMGGAAQPADGAGGAARP